MKLNYTMLAVSDIEKSKLFYWNILGLRTLSHIEGHVVLTGGLALQTDDSWKGFIKKEISYHANDCEIYFEEENFNEFLEIFETKRSEEQIELIHEVIEHSWGQKVIRFYDPDFHIIEVGETMKAVCKRFLGQGKTIEEVAKRMNIPLKAAKMYAK